MKQIYELLCPPYSHSLIVMEHLKCGNSRMTYRCLCFKNPPLGVLEDSREIELSSSIFFLRLQFQTLLALGNILVIDKRLKS